MAESKNSFTVLYDGLSIPYRVIAPNGVVYQGEENYEIRVRLPSGDYTTLDALIEKANVR